MADEEETSDSGVDPEDEEIDDEVETSDSSADPEDEEIDEIAELEARIEELEEQLEAALSRGEGETSQATKWAGWILGTLVGAISLALIVVFIGGGYPQPCDCPEIPEHMPQGGVGGPDVEQQHQALNQFITEHSGGLQECFNSWASSSPEARPGLVINTAVEVEADDQQHVTFVQVTGRDVPEALSQCLEGTVRGWALPVAGRFVLELPFEVTNGPPGGPGSEAAHPEEAGPSGSVEESADGGSGD